MIAGFRRALIGSMDNLNHDKYFLFHHFPGAA
jgi:hypothetical protein